MKSRLIRFFFFSLFVSQSAWSAVSISIEEAGSDVVATFSGSLDVSGLTAPTSIAALPSTLAYNNATSWVYYFGSNAPLDQYQVTFSAAETLHASAFPAAAATSQTGDFIGVSQSATQHVQVLQGYVSGSPINGSSTWAGEDFTSLSLAPGVYTFDYGDDSIIISVNASADGASATSLPVNSWPALLMTLLAFAIFAASRLRKDSKLEF